MPTPNSPDLAPLTRQLKKRLPPQRWAENEARAHERVEIINEVASVRASGLSWRKALAQVAPGVRWPT